MLQNSFEEILLRARQELTPEERFRLAEALFTSAENITSTRSLMELKGLGKECWSRINVGEFVQQERESWNG